MSDLTSQFKTCESKSTSGYQTLSLSPCAITTWRHGLFGRDGHWFNGGGEEHLRCPDSDNLQACWTFLGLHLTRPCRSSVAVRWGRGWTKSQTQDRGQERSKSIVAEWVQEQVQRGSMQHLSLSLRWEAVRLIAQVIGRTSNFQVRLILQPTRMSWRINGAPHRKDLVKMRERTRSESMRG